MLSLTEFALWKRQKQRRGISALGKLDSIEFPYTAKTGLRVFARSSSATSGILPAMKIGDREVSVPAMGEGQIRSLGWVEAGQVIEPVGDFELMVDTGLGQYKKLGA